MRKHFKWTSIICGILSFALFLDCMNQQRFQVVYAENEVTYLSDIKLFEGETEDEARNACQSSGYIFCNKDVNSGTGKKSVYIGYKTSTNKNDAIYDLRLLAMDRGYEIKDKAAMQEEYIKQQTELAETFEAAAIEFCSNYWDGSPKAADAYNGMNLIVVPEEGDMKFGDFVLAGKGTQSFFAKFIVQASTSTLNSVASYLSAGLAPYHNDVDQNTGQAKTTNWAESVINSPLWDVIEDDLDEDQLDELNREYGDSAAGLHKKFQEFAANVENAFQRYSGAQIDATGSVEEIVENTDTVETDETDTIYIDAYNKLNEYEATDGMPLGEYIVNLGKETTDAVNMMSIYPIVDAMSYAQCKMTCLSGLVGATSNIGENTHSPEYNTLLAKTKEKLKSMTNNDFYSIWLNADPDFENSKVAYTSNAIRMNAAKASLEKDTSDDGHKTVETVMKWAGIVSSAITVISFILGKYALTGAIALIAKFAVGTVATTLSSIVGTLTSITTVLGQIGMIIGLFILAFTLVYYFMRWIISMINKNKPKEYTDMPDYVVDAASTGSGTANIKYKAVRRTDGKVGDLNGYEGQQGWVCMYYSKDTRVGSPIIANDEGDIFSIVYGSTNKPSDCDSACFFGEVSAGNCNTFAKKDDVNGIYIHYHTAKSLKNKMADAPDAETPVVTGKQYYSSIIVKTGKTEAEAKARLTVEGYYILDRNLTPSPYGGSEAPESSDEAYYTYIGYQLTQNPDEAIRDIRVATFHSASTNFGDISYGCSGTIGYKANSAQEDESYPGDLPALFMTANPHAGSPIPYGGLHVVDDYDKAQAGWELVTTFSGAPYDFNSVYLYEDVGSDNTDTIGNTIKMIGSRMQRSSSWTHAKSLLYYEPETTYTSGTKYLSGMFFIQGYDVDSYRERAEVGVTATLNSLIDDVKRCPNVVVDSDNLYSSASFRLGEYCGTQKHLYLCYTWSYNPYRALYDAAIYQGTPYVDSLPYNISKAMTYPDKKAGAAETSANYVASSVLAQQSSQAAYVSRGFLSQNAYTNQYFLFGSDSVAAGIYQEELPEGISFGYKRLSGLPTGLFVAGYTAGKNPFTFDDVILSSKACTGNNNAGAITFDVSGEKTLGGAVAEGDFVSVQELKNPFSTTAYNLALPTLYRDGDKLETEATSKYLYLRKAVTKGKYISRVFVGSYCKEDHTPNDKDHEDDEYKALSRSTDYQAMLSAMQAASGEVVAYNLSITNEYQWFNYADKDGLSMLQPANKYQYASYISVARTDREQDAIRGLLLFRSDEKAVPEQIQIQGMAYYCASNTSPLRIVKNDKDGNDPKKDKMEYESYYLYYTYNKGATPGKPLTDISVNSDPFTSGQATTLCADKEDVVAYEGGKKVIKEAAEVYGKSSWNAFIHASYEHDMNTYFNKLYLAQGSTKKEAMLSLLEQGCTEFCDMDLNLDAGGKYIYFGYRGYCVDDDKIKMLGTEAAREAELKSQQQSAVYDIVTTTGEPYHPEGITSQRYQIHYAPVSDVNLNAGTQGPEMYMYYTSVLVANSYNNKVKDDPTAIQSNSPADIFSAPVTKIAFARYDRVPYTNDGTMTGDGEDNIYGWEYIMNIDFRTVTDFNAGVVKFDDDHVPTDNRITAFIQREDGSVKPWGEITGGFVSEFMTVGSVYRVGHESPSGPNAGIAIQSPLIYRFEFNPRPQKALPSLQNYGLNMSLRGEGNGEDRRRGGRRAA